MTDHPQLPSDQALAEHTRAGVEAAWVELRARHSDAIRMLARARSQRHVDATVDDVFVRLREELTADEVDAGADRRPPIRPRIIGLLTGGSYGPAWSPPSTHSEPALDDAELAERREHLDIARAFGNLPTTWQTVLWHRWVERTPAAGLTAILGRRAADVVALEQTAERGLTDAYADVVLSGTPPPDPACRSVIPLLGAVRRDVLPEVQRRVVDAHLGVATAGCTSCRRHLDLLGRLPEVLPPAVVPGLVGLAADRYRSVIGVGALAMGATALAERRSERSRRLARVGAVVAVVLALLGAAFFVREPFGDLDSELADLLERVTPTTEPTDLGSTTTVPGGSSTPDALANRIELVFPGAPQGAVYVPGGRALNLGISLSTPAPVYAGATGTIDTAITNNDTEDASVRFVVRSSPGVSFDQLSSGVGSCVVEQQGGARCTLSLPAGTTGLMSLRFSLDVDVSDRLVVVPSIRSDVLEVPVSFVDGLLLGQVGNGDLRTAGATLGACDVSAACPSGRREASSALVDLPAGAAVERAVLVWEGTRSDAAWADTIGLIPSGSSTAVAVSSGNLAPPSGAATTGFEVGTSETADGSGFRSIADVTDLVRAAGGGDYTVVRAPSTGDPGDGSWTLTVITQSPTSPRRLFVVIRPDQLVEPDNELVVDVPIAGSSPPLTPVRGVTVGVQAATIGAGTSVLTVNGVDVVDDTRSGSAGLSDVGVSGGTVIYDLSISTTEDTLSFVATTSTDALRLASIGLAADIVS